MLPISVLAQKEKIHQSVMFFRWTNNMSLPNKFELNSEMDTRFFMTPIVHHQQTQVLRLLLNRKLNNNWKVGIAFAHFLNSASTPAESKTQLVPEFRWQLEVANKQTIKDWLSLAHRYRFEHKFTHNVNKTYTELLDGYKNNFRFRYQFGLDFKVWEKEQQHLNITIADEVLINAGKAVGANIFDQNRLSTAMKYTLNKHFAVELMHIFWMQNTSSSLLLSRQVIRANFITSFDIKKKEKE